MPESLFWCFLVKFTKFVRTPFLQNSTGRLLLIITVSVVKKGILANETVNYDTKALREKCPNNKYSYYGVNLCIQSKCRKIQTRKNSVSGHFSSICINLSSQKCNLLKKAVQMKEQVSEAIVHRPQIRCS